MPQEFEASNHSLPFLAQQLRRREHLGQVRGLIELLILRAYALQGGANLRTSTEESESLEDLAVIEHLTILEKLVYLSQKITEFLVYFQQMRQDLDVLEKAINVVRQQNGSSPISIREARKPFNLQQEILQQRLSSDEYLRLRRAQSWLISLSQRNYQRYQLGSEGWQTLGDADHAYNELHHFVYESQVFLADALEVLTITGQLEPEKDQLVGLIITFFDHNPYPNLE